MISPESELLLCCARPRPDAVRLEAIVRDGVDWERLLAMAGPHGMLPLLHAHVASRVPAPVLERLRATIQEISRHNLFLTGELLELLRSFDARGVRALAYKGPALAMLAYGNVAMRHFADLDVLVHPEDVARAAEVLERAGYRYRPQLAMTAAQETVFRRFACELLFARDDGRSKVDLHWAILPKMFAFPLDAHGLWERSVQAGGIRTLSPEDHLLVICAHNSKHRWERLAWIADVAHLVERQPIDWDQLFARARSVGCERMLQLGLFLADVAAPPSRRLDRRRPAAAPVSALADEVRRDLFASPHGDDPRFYLRARERWRDKLSFVLRAATTPTVHEIASIALPAALSFLYYPLRPLRLLIKYARSMLRFSP